MTLKAPAEAATPAAATTPAPNNSPPGSTIPGQTPDDLLDGAPPPAEPAAGGASAEPAPAGAPSTNLTKEDIAEILKGAGLGDRPAPAAPAQPQRDYTQEELEQMFHFWKPDPAFLQLLNLHENPKAAEAFVQMRDGMMRQAMALAEYKLNAVIKEIRDNELAPMRQFVDEHRATSLRNEFFQEHKDLEPYEELVDAVSAKLQANGFRGTKDQIFAETAKTAKALVAQLTGKNGAPAAVPATKGNKMAALTGGGQTGIAPAGAGKPKRLEGMDVFD